ncbi:MAG: hypothetical protein Q4C48_10855 [Lachnospiraceae bacterium]|nr:hypothetical protein [Lachnospiraceae bacterium]
MAETTYTLKKVHTNSYTVLGNAMLRDPELALRERGLLATMLSLDDGWRFSVRGLASILCDGESAIRSALKTLEAKGYLRRERLRDAQGRITATLYEVSDTPVFLDAAARLTADKLETDKSQLQEALVPAGGTEEDAEGAQLSLVFPAPEEPSEKTKPAEPEAHETLSLARRSANVRAEDLPKGNGEGLRSRQGSCRRSHRESCRNHHGKRQARVADPETKETSAGTDGQGGCGIPPPM